MERVPRQFENLQSGCGRSLAASKQRSLHCLRQDQHLVRLQPILVRIDGVPNAEAIDAVATRSDVPVLGVLVDELRDQHQLVVFIDHEAIVAAVWDVEEVRLI